MAEFKEQTFRVEFPTGMDVLQLRFQIFLYYFYIIMGDKGQSRCHHHLHNVVTFTKYSYLSLPGVNEQIMIDLPRNTVTN